jgi:hypothetical protein
VTAFYSYETGNFTASEGFPYIWKQDFVKEERENENGRKKEGNKVSIYL